MCHVPSTFAWLRGCVCVCVWTHNYNLQVDRLRLLNTERFSSGPKGFQLFGSATGPKYEWQLLGDFVAVKTAEYQEFQVVDSPVVR